MLLKILDLMLKRQDEFLNEINSLRDEINLVKGSQTAVIQEIRMAGPETPAYNPFFKKKRIAPRQRPYG
jgi:hypothetical protein